MSIASYAYDALFRPAVGAVRSRFTKVMKDFTERQIEAGCRRVERSQAREIAQAGKIRVAFQDSIVGKRLDKLSGAGTAQGLVQKYSQFSAKAKEVATKAYVVGVITTFAIPFVALFGALLPNPASHDLWNFMLGTGKYRKRNNCEHENVDSKVKQGSGSAEFIKRTIIPNDKVQSVELLPSQ